MAFNFKIQANVQMRRVQRLSEKDCLLLSMTRKSTYYFMFFRSVMHARCLSAVGMMRRGGWVERSEPPGETAGGQGPGVTGSVFGTRASGAPVREQGHPRPPNACTLVCSPGIGGSPDGSASARKRSGVLNCKWSGSRTWELVRLHGIVSPVGCRDRDRLR